MEINKLETDNIILDNERPVLLECQLCGRRRSIFADPCTCIQNRASEGKQPLREGESYLLTEEQNG